MRYILYFFIACLAPLLSCEEGALPTKKVSGSTYAQMIEMFNEYLKLEESRTFSDLSTGLNFGEMCASTELTITGSPEDRVFDLNSGSCFELSEPEAPIIFFSIFSSAPIDPSHTLYLHLTFLNRGKPQTGNYYPQCSDSDCDRVYLTLYLVDSEGYTYGRYNGFPEVISVVNTSNRVEATFDAPFFDEDSEDLAFQGAATLYCCN